MFRGNLLKVADNSGVVLVRCINIFRRRILEVGGLLTVYVRKKKKLRKTVKKDLLSAVTLQLRGQQYRPFGDYYIRTDKVSIALVNSDLDQFLGTKVYAPLRIELFLRKNTLILGLLKYFRHVI